MSFTRANHGSTLLVHDIVYAHIWKPNTGSLSSWGDDELDKAAMRVHQELHTQVEDNQTSCSTAGQAVMVTPLAKPSRSVWPSAILAATSTNESARVNGPGDQPAQSPLGTAC